MGKLDCTSSALHVGNRDVLERGSTVGRYVILEVIGSGGIGVVYSAYDPKLDRKVAIKLLRSGRRPVVDDDLQRRMVREAQAMARLSHRNVVPVHDVGMVGTNVFIAMEYVQGRTLRAWLQQKRDQSEILRVFIGAGWGLAAAHAAGIIHRDFKPDNVLLGDDGRVQVTDFGLARARMASDHQPTPEWTPEGGSDSVGALTDGPVGTPGYMALEQFDGKNVDSRADQFSFCVALYEALYGQRPFAGATLPELMQNLRAGKVREPSRDAHIPQRLRRVLLRGLSAQPSSRYPSMELLLKALSKSPRAYWQRASMALAAATLLAGVGWTYQSARAHQRELCLSGGRQLSGVWDASVKQKVKQSFLNTNHGYAPTTWNSVERLLDGYAHEWSTVHGHACEATHVRNEQPEVIYGLQLVCLDRRLQEIKALTQLFSHADPTVLENAVHAASSLPSVAPCADTANLARSVRLPETPVLRVKVEELRAKLAEARALFNAGKYAASAELARTAAQAANEISDRPVQAEAFFAWGRAEQELSHYPTAQQALEKALWAAEASTAAEDLVVRSWLSLALLVGHRRARIDDGYRLSQNAAAVIERLGHPPELELELHKSLGHLYIVVDKVEDSLSESQRALELAEQIHGPNHPEIASVLNNLLAAYVHLGRYQQADDMAQQALQIREAALGPDHPLIAVSLNNLGTLHQRLGRFDEAILLHERASRINRASIGNGHPDVADNLNNLANAYRRKGRTQDARETLKQSIAIYESTLGLESKELAAPLEGLGMLVMRSGNPVQAIPLFRRALEINRKAWGANHSANAIMLTDIGQALLMQRKSAQALSPLTTALLLREGTECPPSELATTRYVLARALWESGKDRVRARQLALLAWDGMQSAEDKPEELAELNAWMVKRGWN